MLGHAPLSTLPLSGEPPVSVTGTGGVIFAVSALAASGTETFTGTGSETFAVAGLSASGAETFTGTGAEIFAVAALSATGTETFTGTGAETFAVAALVASGTETFTGSGAETISVAALAASGTETITGSGGDIFSVSTLDGSGAESFAATAVVAIQVSAFDATGAETFLATAGDESPGGPAIEGIGGVTNPEPVPEPETEVFHGGFPALTPFKPGKRIGAGKVWIQPPMIGGSGGVTLPAAKLPEVELPPAKPRHPTLAELRQQDEEWILLDGDVGDLWLLEPVGMAVASGK